MHRAGASPWTIQTALVLFGPTDVLLAFAILCVFRFEQASLLRLVYHGTFFSILVKNTTDVLNFTPSVNIKTILFSNIVLHIIPALVRVI